MYKTFVISLKDTGHGKHQESAAFMLPQTLSHCNQHGWEVEVVDAVNGYTLTEHDWKNFGFSVPRPSTKKINKIGNLPGAQGCFLSHYKLWQRCVGFDQPIVVLEDDAQVLSPIPEIVTDKDLIKLHDPRPPHEHKKLGVWTPGAFAYWLTPQGAKKLIEFSNNNGVGHADKLIGSKVLNWDYLNPHIVKLGPRIGSSTNPNRYPYENLSIF